MKAFPHLGAHPFPPGLQTLGRGLFARQGPTVGEKHLPQGLLFPAGGRLCQPGHRPSLSAELVPQGHALGGGKHRLKQAGLKPRLHLQLPAGGEEIPLPPAQGRPPVQPGVIPPQAAAFSQQAEGLPQGFLGGAHPAAVHQGPGHRLQQAFLAKVPQKGGQGLAGMALHPPQESWADKQFPPQGPAFPPGKDLLPGKLQPG